MKSLLFTKMHGQGNDFMVVDATREPCELTSAQIQAIGDRHRGVGFDQLLVLGPASAAEADFTYSIFNNDGSTALQCGNGARCVAKFIRRQKLSNKNKLRLCTAGKITQVQIEQDDTVTVEMDAPIFAPAQIPFVPATPIQPYQLLIAGKSLPFHVVNVGNPHAVILVDAFNAQEVADIGALLSVHPAFPQGVNVGFMQIIAPDHIHLRVYERGAGLTLACGSGACAAVAVGRRLELLHPSVQVTQVGGTLWITWEGETAPIRMRGPAEFVYDGQLRYNTRSFDHDGEEI